MGQQSHPGRDVKAGGRKGKELEIKSVLEGLGVDDVLEINAFSDVKQNVDTIKKALDHNGPSALISHGECALYHFRNYRHAGGKIVPYFIDEKLCESRYACIFNFMCPAISVDESGKAKIADDICVGCGVCAQLCPHGAIRSTAVKHGLDDVPIKTIEEYDNYKNRIAKEGNQ